MTDIPAVYQFISIKLYTTSNISKNYYVLQTNTNRNFKQLHSSTLQDCHHHFQDFPYASASHAGIASLPIYDDVFPH